MGYFWNPIDSNPSGNCSPSQLCNGRFTSIDGNPLPARQPSKQATRQPTSPLPIHQPAKPLLPSHQPPATCLQLLNSSQYSPASSPQHPIPNHQSPMTSQLPPAELVHRASQPASLKLHHHPQPANMAWGPGAGDWWLGTGDWGLGTAGWSFVAGDWWLETGGWGLVAGDWWLGTGKQWIRFGSQLMIRI